MGDRNFDDLADRFEKRIHFSDKGDLRRNIIWRDIKKYFDAKERVLHRDAKALDIIDIGAGLGYFSIQLADMGHRVCYNDLSKVMMQKAQGLAAEKNLKDSITWSQQPYQELLKHQTQQADIILCHALLEWLEKPSEAIQLIKKALKPKGMLSLCFYNPSGLIFRNLICGNFHYLDSMQSETKDHTMNIKTDGSSLTPPNPNAIEQVMLWLEANGLSIETFSGIRVFSDYVLEKRGGHQSSEAVQEMEMRYSQLEPYRRIGRYVHIIASAPDHES